MMKALLLVVFLLPLLLIAQRSQQSQSTTRFYSGASSAKSTPVKRAEEVLLPPAGDLACYTEGEVTVETVPDSGFVFGSNLFSDVVVGQRILNTGGETIRVKAVEAAFEFPGEGADDVFLSALVLSDPGPGGTEYTVLGESDSLRAGDLNISETELLFSTFTFAEPVVLNDASFFVAIDFSRAYATDPPPFIGLLSTADDCGDGDNVIIFTSDDQGDFVDTYADIYVENASRELYLEVVVDDSTTVGINTPRLANYRLESFPNPTLDAFILRFSADHPINQYTARLTDLSGRLLRQVTPSVNNSGQYTVDWSLADLPAGLYLYRIDGPEGRQSGKLVKR